MSVKPITPDDAHVAKGASIPDGMIEAANELIVENLGLSGWARFTIDELSKRARQKGVDTSKSHLRHEYDIEPLFRAAGWAVEYHSGDYTDPSPGTFIFETPAI